VPKIDTKYQCRNYDPDRWFPLGTGWQAQLDIDFAKSVCNMCPVQIACATWAFDHGVEFGIWGGLTEQERREARRRGPGRGIGNALHPTHVDALVD
jgi:WhiB family redox-sensing transcriptional regulator